MNELQSDEMLYILTTGSHSSYSIIGIYKGKKGIDIKALGERWVREFPDKAVKPWSTKSGKQYFDDEHFRDFVIKEGGLEPVESEEMHIPDYALDMKYCLGVEQP